MGISRSIKLLLIATSLSSQMLLASDADLSAVSAQVDALRKAMIAGDAKALKALSSPKLSYGHSSGVMEDQSAFIDKLASGKSDFVTLDLSEQTISISGDTALVRHTLHADIERWRCSQ